jgi:hypothetical protein
VPADALALSSVQGRIEGMQRVLAAKLPEMAEYRLPRREIDGQVAPRTASARHVEDGVEDAAQRMRARSAAS